MGRSFWFFLFCDNFVLKKQKQNKTKPKHTPMTQADLFFSCYRCYCFSYFCDFDGPNFNDTFFPKLCLKVGIMSTIL